ncbi:universal stress protein [Streptomyces antibioticus]|uniref:universal stress protein n=1 Tax=Streptomyces antibioticus TaxID=1890 RepID=UPI0036CE82C6
MTREVKGDLVGKVVVGVSGSLGSMTALHRAVGEAQVRDAEVWAVLAWQVPNGTLGSRVLLDVSLSERCRADAVGRLREAIGTAFGGRGPGMRLSGIAVRGTPGAALVHTAGDPDDLLVLGTGVRSAVRRLVRPSVAHYCLAHAACPVLTVPPSPLQAEHDTMHRRNTWRAPLDLRELAPSRTCEEADGSSDLDV